MQVLEKVGLLDRRQQGLPDGLQIGTRVTGSAAKRQPPLGLGYAASKACQMVY